MRHTALAQPIDQILADLLDEACRVGPDDTSWHVWCGAFDAAVAADDTAGIRYRVRHYWLVADVARAAYLKETTP